MPRYGLMEDPWVSIIIIIIIIDVSSKCLLSVLQPSYAHHTRSQKLKAIHVRGGFKNFAVTYNPSLNHPLNISSFFASLLFSYFLFLFVYLSIHLSIHLSSWTPIVDSPLSSHWALFRTPPPPSQPPYTI